MGKMRLHIEYVASNQDDPCRRCVGPLKFLPLVKAVRQEGADIKVNDVVEVESVLYLGDGGGIACAIGLWGGKTVVVTSLTHLRIDRDHPLAERIQMRISCGARDISEVP
jgi:hypothetical protein